MTTPSAAGSETPREKKYVSYLTVTETASLIVVAEQVSRAFPEGYGCFHVGSSLSRKDYRDVDVRLILPDEAFVQLFGTLDVTTARPDRWFMFCWAISEWMQKRTGLPIDFQVQAISSKENKDKGPRNALFFADVTP